MRYLLIIICVFIVYKMLRAWYDFIKLKESVRFQLLKNDEEIEQNPSNPYNYCRRASLLTEIQNFPEAINNYKKALSMYNQGLEFKVNSGKFSNPNQIKEGIEKNIEYCYKPLPWSKKNPKDLSSDWFTFFLIDRFGNGRFNF